MLSREVAGGVPDGGKLASHGECLSVFVESVGCVSRHPCGNAVLGSCWWCHTEMLSREVAGGVPDGGKLPSMGSVCLCLSSLPAVCPDTHAEMLSWEVAGGVIRKCCLRRLLAVYLTVASWRLMGSVCLCLSSLSAVCPDTHAEMLSWEVAGGVIRKCCLGRLLAVYLTVASWRLMGSVCLCLSSLSAVCPDTHAEMLSWEVAGGVIRKCCLGRLLAVHLTVASWRVMGSVCLCLSQ